MTGNFLKIFKKCEPFLKVFIEFVTTSHLFYGVIFCLFGGLSFLTRDGTDTPCIGRRSLNHWTTREVPVRENFDCTRCRE